MKRAMSMMRSRVMSAEIPRRADGGVDFDFRPRDAAELAVCLGDALWRVCSGALYKITVKGDRAADREKEDAAGDAAARLDEGLNNLVLAFRPNSAQRDLLHNLWYRNIILKVRQRGFTTLICILWLDHALFNSNARCGIIAQDREAADAIFRDKVKFAYDHLPMNLKKAMPLARDSSHELLFAHNNSSVRVATSMRSGTIQRLLVSEFGKICAKFPAKADEVVTGSLPAVPKSGIVVIESTAEGRDGAYYAMAEQARKRKDAGKKLSQKEYRFHFADWMDAAEYRIDPSGVVITDQDHAYFDRVEVETGKVITLPQRAWWVSTRDTDFAGQVERMWQEYPSTPMEAFQQSSEGCYYSVQMTAARKQGRITQVPYLQGTPVNTFWDIGRRDGTAVWLHQRVGVQDRFIGFIEAWNEPYAYFVSELQKTGYIWGQHFLPHDGAHIRQGQNNNVSPKVMLENLGLSRVRIVSRVGERMHGIQATRDALGACWFDEVGCKAGIAHLDQYKKAWSVTSGTWSDEPQKDVHTEAADAFRQFAQAGSQGLLVGRAVATPVVRRRVGGWMS